MPGDSQLPLEDPMFSSKFINSVMNQSISMSMHQYQEQAKHLKKLEEQNPMLTELRTLPKKID
jgi:hypothetical protein